MNEEYWTVSEFCRVFIPYHIGTFRANSDSSHNQKINWRVCAKGRDGDPIWREGAIRTVQAVQKIIPLRHTEENYLLNEGIDLVI